jgi:hypothetical protein
MTSPPVAPEPIMPPPLAPRPVTPPPIAPAAAFGSPGNRPVSVPPPPPGMTPIVPGARPPLRPASAPPAASRPATSYPAAPSSPSYPSSYPAAPASSPSYPAAPSSPSYPPAAPSYPPAAASFAPPSSAPPAETGQPFRPTLTNAALNNARAERQRTVIPPRPITRNGVPSAPPANGATDYSLPLPAPRPSSAPHPSSAPSPSSAPPEMGEPGSRSNWPLLNGEETTTAAMSTPPSDGRVRPPWQDMPKEPPALRLVESGLNAVAADVTAITEPPPLRLVDHSPNGRNGRSPRRTTLTALERSTQPPVPAEGDGDLLIFAAARSAWFTGTTEEPDLDWTNPNDTGWRAAEKAATPSYAAETSAGLPKRVPQANLVPGSPLREERPLRIVRDAASIAAHTTGYFRGWRRGQEIGGYAIGGRPGRESAGGWDFSRDGQPEDYRNGNGNGFRSN